MIWKKAGPRMTTKIAGKIKSKRWEQDLGPRLLGHFLGTLPAVLAERLGMDLQPLDQARPESLGLGDDRNQAAKLAQVGAIGHVLDGLAIVQAELHLALNDEQLAGQGGVGGPQLFARSVAGPIAASALPRDR